MRDLRAYKAMFYFLDDRYERCPTDELGALLGQLSLDIWADGTPGDPAVPGDWERALTRAEADFPVATPLLRKAS